MKNFPTLLRFLAFCRGIKRCQIIAILVSAMLGWLAWVELDAVHNVPRSVQLGPIYMAATIALSVAAVILFLAFWKDDRQ